MAIKKPKGRRKGILFTTDALIGAAILISVIVLASNFYISEKRTATIDATSQDLVGVLSNLKIGEVNNSLIKEYIANGTITKQNISVLEQIGEFWALDQPGLAQNISGEILGQLGLENTNIAIYIGGDEIYALNVTPAQTVKTNKRFISGIDQDKPIDGFISRASLKGHNQHFRSTFSYFGGFIGQGNVTRKVFLADDVSSIKSAQLELDTPSNFSLFINGVLSGNYTVDPAAAYLQPSTWNISAADVANFQAGENDIKYVFEGDDKYVAGGLLKIAYFTNQTEDVGVIYMSNTSASSRFYLEGTEGFINTFSSFFVPGDVNSLKLYLKFDIKNTNAEAFFIVGNSTVYRNSSEGLVEVTLENHTFMDRLEQDSVTPSDVSLTTIPLRFGLGNLSTSFSNADIMLINDVSGSMEWCTNQTSACCTNGACNSWPPGCACGTEGSYCGYESGASHWRSNCTGGDVKRIGALQNASKQFITQVIGNGPLVGLVSYESSTDATHALSSNQASLEAQIDTYDADGGTCICCGINSAVEELTSTNTTIIIPRNSEWRYLDTDPASPPTNWTELSFDESSWSEDDAGLGRGYYSWWHGFSAQTTLTNYNGDYFFRRKFNITDASAISDSILSLASDDGATVYVNGVEVFDNLGSNQYANYWNQNNIDISSNLVDGENIIAVQVRNTRNTGGSCWWQCNYFDLELSVSVEGSADPRYKAMIVMSDGQATVECAEQGVTGDLNGDSLADQPEDDAIQAACDAYNDHGIIIHAVGFGTDADEVTLRNISSCGQGDYYGSENIDELSDVYSSLADIIIEDSQTQLVNISGVAGILYPESYIEFNYTPIVTPPEFGKLTLSATTASFQNNQSNGSVLIPSYADLIDMTAVTYSAEKWSDNVTIMNTLGTQNAFLLEDFSDDYQMVGDPYRVHIPASLVPSGDTSNIITRTGLGPQNSSGGSPSNKIVYTVRVQNSVDFTNVHDKADGCTWTIEFEDDTQTTIDVPSNYSGSSQCFFSNQSFDSSDAHNTAFNNLLTQFDFDQNGKVDVLLSADDTQLDAVSIEGVPSLWGPLIAEVRVWK